MYNTIAPRWDQILIGGVSHSFNSVLKWLGINSASRVYLSYTVMNEPGNEERKTRSEYKPLEPYIDISNTWIISNHNDIGQGFVCGYVSVYLCIGYK